MAQARGRRLRLAGPLGDAHPVGPAVLLLARSSPRMRGPSARRRPKAVRPENPARKPGFPLRGKERARVHRFGRGRKTSEPCEARWRTSPPLRASRATACRTSRPRSTPARTRRRATGSSSSTSAAPRSTPCTGATGWPEKSSTSCPTTWCANGANGRASAPRLRRRRPPSAASTCARLCSAP